MNAILVLQVLLDIRSPYRYSILFLYTFLSTVFARLDLYSRIIPKHSLHIGRLCHVIVHSSCSLSLGFCDYRL
jgi:hypothetical protein